jgi:hypothetical protein
LNELVDRCLGKGNFFLLGLFVSKVGWVVLLEFRKLGSCTCLWRVVGGDKVRDSFTFLVELQAFVAWLA